MKIKIIVFISLIFFLSCGLKKTFFIEDYQLRNNYAVRCMQLNLFKESLFHLKQILNKEDEIIYNNIAITYEYLGNKEEAAKFYKKAKTYSKKYKKIIDYNIASFEEKKIKKIPKMHKSLIITSKKEQPPHIPATLIALIVTNHEEKLTNIIKNIFSNKIFNSTGIRVIDVEEEFIDKIEDIKDQIEEGVDCIVIVEVVSLAEDLEHYYGRRDVRFLKEEDRFIYSLPEYIKREIKINLKIKAILLGENNEKKIKYTEDYKGAASATCPYSVLYDGSLQAYDAELISKILEEPVEKLIKKLKPYYKIYKRIAILY